MILLDTHAWFWWVQDVGRIPAETRRRLENEEASGTLLVSTVSVWEIALKVSIGKLELPMEVREWVAAASAYPSVHVIPLSSEVALESTLLPGSFHNDPADRFIVATARTKSVPLVTADRKIRAYPYVRTIWD